MIRTIIFDIGNVLAGFTWRQHFENLGYDTKMVERLADATVRNKDWGEYDRGCLNDRQIEDLLAAKDPEIEKEIRRALADFSDLVTGYEYAIPWVKELKEKGYQILVLSNFSRKAFQECWHALDFLPYTDGGILSFQDKLIKPDRAVYQLILERYHLKPEECVFLDDTQCNVDAAQKEGLHAIRFENREQAVLQLQKLGVR